MATKPYCLTAAVRRNNGELFHQTAHVKDNALKKPAFMFICMVFALLAMPAEADVEWSGFASFGGGFTTSSNEAMLGYTNDLGFKPDTLFALQGTSKVSDRLSVTVQLLARGEENFDVGVEWAYLQYKLNDSWTVNAGQLRLPMYSYSDSLDVGYSYHWLRPPASVYRAPFDSLVGLSFANNTMIANTLVTTQVVTGRFNDDIRFNKETVEADVRNIIGINLTAEHENLRVRGGYFIADDVSLRVTNPNLVALVDVLNAYAVPQTADALMAESDQGRFGGVGFMYDNSDWFLSGEFTNLRVPNSMVAKQLSHYLSAGKRFGAYTIHATFEQTKDRRARPELTLPSMAPVIAQIAGLPAYDELAGLVQAAALSEVKRFDYYTLGLRYDFDLGVAFKVDLTKMHDNRGDAGATLISFAVQTVF